MYTAPGEPVLFLPNDAAYYYLTDRPSPTRFVLGHQIVGDDHRREVLADLESAPPRYIVWDHDALVVDGISHLLAGTHQVEIFVMARDSQCWARYLLSRSLCLG